MDSFFTQEELEKIGFKAVGRNVKISRKASFYGTHLMEIGDNVRIDDFCILSGNIKLGNNIHISAYAALYGAFGIELEDYTGISPRSTVYSAMDDFSGDYLIGPINSPETIHVTGGKVVLHRFSQIGCNCVIFPGVEIGEGCAVGAMSLVKHSLPQWSIFAGNPIRFIKNRSNRMLTYITDNKDFTPPRTKSATAVAKISERSSFMSFMRMKTKCA